MESDQPDIKVIAPLHEIEFLSLDDLANEQDRNYLLGCVKTCPGVAPPGSPGRPWQTPKREQNMELDFGSATAVFNSLQSGAHFDPNISMAPPPLSLPPYISGIPIPTPAQHIHINNFTANLNFPGHPVVSTPSGPASLPSQPLPFTVGFPGSGPYVAPFPQPSPSPPVFATGGNYPTPIMVYQPALHLSMYPQPHYHTAGPPQQEVDQAPPTREHKETTNIMFGSTPVVSIRHSSSDEEYDEPKPTPQEDPHEFHPRSGSIPQEYPRPTEREGPRPCQSQNNVVMPEKMYESMPQELPAQFPPTPRPSNPPFPKDTLKTVPQANSPPPESPPSGPKSWASLFTPSGGSLTPTLFPGDKPTARIPPFTPNSSGSAMPGPSQEDRELSNFLRNYQLNHMAPAFLPRGLTNRSNWCFVNAILQALLACPPFYNLMKGLPCVLGLKSGKSTTPMLDSVVEFINEMTPLETMNKNQKKDKARKKEDLPTGNALEPSYVYRTLLQLESETFKVIEGRQEDAEEFLTCMLNMISDEMMALLKLTEEEPEDPQSQNSSAVEEVPTAPLEWQEVGARGKSCVTRRITDHASIVTPVQQLALGLCRYSVKSANNETSATLQPFFTLQLDIQSDNVTSVDDALLENFSSEQLDGYICSKTNMEVEASRNLSLEELPPILILHLKRFVYNGTTGGCQKVMKHVEFSVDLEISRDILSVASKSKYTTKQRQYKLFGVVYHNGREATKGHYVADVYHTGYASWLHCDDSIIKPTAEQLVTQPAPNSVPYILFYRRGDTMVGVEKTIK